MSQAPNPTPEQVAILLATYQGAKYLPAQLNSFSWQTYPHWQLWASDDGSHDNTLEILQHYQQACSNQVVLRTGPNRGFAENFMHMVTDPTIQADYYAYSDQDDVWEPDKLMRAITMLRQFGSQQPALYCSRTSLINAHDRHLGYAHPRGKPGKFGNALVHNIASGNTMVFNNAARQLLLHTPQSSSLSYHDWWTYIVISCYGGSVYYDYEPTVRYRQHDNNVTGYRAGVQQHLQRLKYVIANQYKQAIDDYCQSLLTLININNRAVPPEHRALLTQFIEVRKAGLLRKLRYIPTAKIYHQDKIGNLGMYLLLILGKM